MAPTLGAGGTGRTRSLGRVRGVRGYFLSRLAADQFGSPVRPRDPTPGIGESHGLSPEPRPGDKSLELIIRTDERYGHDGLFQGPRGWTYWNGLEHARPIQNPNLWPEKQSTYFLSQFELPAGSTLTWRFEYPHARYFQFALYKRENNTFVSTGEFFAGAQLEPDAASRTPTCGPRSSRPTSSPSLSCPRGAP